MRLLTYLNSKKQERVGILESNHIIIDAAEAIEWWSLQSKPSISGPPPQDMLTVIRRQDEYLPAFRQISAAFHEGKLPHSVTLSEKEIHLCAPIPRPVSMRDGYAFRQHVEAARKSRGLPMIPEFDQFPTFYFTNHLNVTGPGEVRVQKLARERLDYELEVAVVIGKEGRNIPASKADEHIFGYLIMNDWSARALQTEEMKMNLGPAKGKDFATSLGPYLVTRDELEKYAVHGPTGDRYRLTMKGFLNGKQLSEGNLGQMHWTFAQIIERASYGVRLQPGEVIGSGTVGTGCLMELNGSKITDNLWLKPGDEVILEVEALGQLKNQIVAAD